MPQTTPTVLDYARRGAGVARRGGAGFVAFIAAILLSPLVVLTVTQFLNDYYHDAVVSYALPVIIVLMIAAVLVPLFALGAGSGGSSRAWALAGLVISLLGWGCILLLALMWAAGGGLPSGVGVH